MSFQMYIPCARLCSYVHMFWSWEGYAPPHVREHILPHAEMELTINLSGKLCFYYPEDDYRPRPINGLVVGGSRSTFFHVDTASPQSLLAVWFKPGGALPFVGVGAHDLHNQHIGLDTFWGSEAHFLHEQLLEAHSTYQRFHLLEQAFLDRLSKPRTCIEAVHYALTAFNIPKPSVKRVVDHMGMSAPRFIQHFRDTVGLTPKRYCRLQRFHHALRLMAHRQHHGWTDLALRCGYFDQAHFINDFRAFAGITPSQYRPQSPEHHLNLPVPN